MTLVGAGAWLVDRVHDQGHRVGLRAPPLNATPDVDVTASLALAAIVGAVIAARGPRFAATLSWRWLLLAATASAAVWSVSVALVRGTHRLTSGVVSPNEYLHAVESIDSAGPFLRGFVDHIAGYPVHVQGHPPGFVLLLHALDGVGLGGAHVVAAVCIVGGAAAVPAVLLAARAVAGEQPARRAAPFLVIAPASIWVATSADAFFAGVSAWAAALVVLGIMRPSPTGDRYALAGGALFGASAFLSYGLVLLGVGPFIVAVARRQVRPILIATMGAVPVFVAFAAAGFWWPTGLLATRERYFAGIASERPYLVFLVVNLAALAVALGPAIAPALATLRDRGVWLLVGGGLTMVVLADLSGMSKAEVERIWLPFVPWILVAGASLGRRAAVASRWLGVQVAFAIGIETFVRTPW